MSSWPLQALGVLRGILLRRYIGRNLGHFMNAAMHLAAQTTEEELQGSKWREINVSNVAARTTPSDFEGLPDFLTVNRVEKTDHWRKQGQNMATYPTNYAGKPCPCPASNARHHIFESSN